MYDTNSLFFLTLTAVSFFALFFISALLHAARKEKKKFIEMVVSKSKAWRFYKRIHQFFFHDSSYESYVFTLTSAQQSLRVFTVIFSSALYAGSLSLSHYLESYAWMNPFEILKCAIFFFFLIASFILMSDFLPRIWAMNSPLSLIRVAKRPSELFLILLSPLIALLYHLVRLASPQSTFKPFKENKKRQLIDLFEDIEDEKLISEHDKRLFTSVINFRTRIAREIMKPRVELFCIPEEMTVEAAAIQLQKEGYSRVPVYQGNIDTITGILFFKDTLKAYMEYAEQVHSDAHIRDENNPLKKTVSHMMKKVYYCPETKKISSLLQEFRKRKTHFAVVVDEYGGTSGVVTIEDILEEIVGDISDEYDDQEAIFRSGPNGSWIVDAQMNILDVQEELGIEIPQDDDYDTIAGYVFYRLGAIPQSGVVIHHDRFEMKILKSNDRMVEEVLLTPLHAHTTSQEESDDEE